MNFNGYNLLFTKLQLYKIESHCICTHSEPLCTFHSSISISFVIWNNQVDDFELTMLWLLNCHHCYWVFIYNNVCRTWTIKTISIGNLQYFSPAIFFCIHRLLHNYKFSKNLRIIFKFFRNDSTVQYFMDTVDFFLANFQSVLKQKLLNFCRRKVILSHCSPSNVPFSISFIIWNRVNEWFRINRGKAIKLPLLLVSIYFQ